MSRSEDYNRALLLHGPKRDIVLTLDEVRQYGTDSFEDPNYVQIYGMSPVEWHGRGIRLLGRTVVECTRDALADRIGSDVAAVAAKLPAGTPITVLDPFAGSCNTLYWILRHLPESVGIACESDPQVYALTKANIARLDRAIELIEGDYESLLTQLDIAPDRGLITFVAPPWGTALDETLGLDLRRTTPSITDIVQRIAGIYHDRRIIFAIQVYEKVNTASLADVQRSMDWSELRLYGLNVEGHNHGILLGTKAWRP
jgi:hypothetical protein